MVESTNPGYHGIEASDRATREVFVLGTHSSINGDAGYGVPAARLDGRKPLDHRSRDNHHLNRFWSLGDNTKRCGDEELDIGEDAERCRVRHARPAAVRLVGPVGYPEE